MPPRVGRRIDRGTTIARGGPGRWHSRRGRRRERMGLSMENRRRRRNTTTRPFTTRKTSLKRCRIDSTCTPGSTIGRETRRLSTAGDASTGNGITARS
ncbi:unnamed protein product [Ectocarpus sp. 12 AP-2014]